MGQENVFHDILERKNGFCRRQKEKVQKVETLEFLKKA